MQKCWAWMNSRIAKDESLNVLIHNKDSGSKMLTVPYVNNGKFRFPGLIFFDTAKVYYQFNTNRKLSNESAVIFKNGLYSGFKKINLFNDHARPGRPMIAH